MTKYARIFACVVTILTLLTENTAVLSMELPPEATRSIQAAIEGANFTFMNVRAQVKLEEVSLDAPGDNLLLKGLRMELSGLLTYTMGEVALSLDSGLVLALAGLGALPEGDINIPKVIITDQKSTSADTPPVLVKNVLMEGIQLPSALVQDMLEGKPVDAHALYQGMKLKHSISSDIQLGEGSHEQRLGSIDRITVSDCAKGSLKELVIENVNGQDSGITLHIDAIRIKNVNVPSPERLQELSSSTILEKLLQKDRLAAFADELFLSEHPVLERVSLKGIEVKALGASLRAAEIGLGRQRAHRLAIWLNGITADGINNFGIKLPTDLLLNAEAALDFSWGEIVTEHLVDVRGLGRITAKATPLIEQMACTDLDVTLEDKGGLAWLILNTMEDLSELDNELTKAEEQIMETAGPDSAGQNFAQAVRTFIRKPGTLRLRSRFGLVITPDDADRIAEAPAQWLSATVDEGSETLTEQVRAAEEQCKNTR